MSYILLVLRQVTFLPTSRCSKDAHAVCFPLGEQTVSRLSYLLRILQKPICFFSQKHRTYLNFTFPSGSITIRDTWCARIDAHQIPRNPFPPMRSPESRRRWVLSLVLVLGIASWAYAQSVETLVLGTTDGAIEASEYISVFVPSDEPTSLETVLNNRGTSNAWHPASEVILPPEAFFWVRLRLKRSPNVPASWHIVPPFDEVSAYLVHDSTITPLGRTGHMIPRQERQSIAGAVPEIRFSLTAEQPVDLYLNVRYHPDRYGFDASDLSLLTIWPADLHEQTAQTWRFFYGSFVGMMLAMALYNLFLFFAFRDWSYWYYVWGTIFFAVFAAEAHLFLSEQFWPAHWPVVPELSFFSLIFALGCSLQFVRLFLDTPRYTPRLDLALKVCLALLGVPLVAALASVWSLAENSTALLSLVIISLSLVAGILTWRHAFRPALYYLIAVSTFLLGSIIYILMWFGLLPATVFTQEIVLLGKALETILLSLGLADRINTIQAEKRAALLEVERTEAHAASLAERDALKTQLLNMASHDLKSPLQGILGFTDVLRDEVDDVSPLQEPLSIMQVAAENMLTLVHNLLYTSALDGDNLILDRHPLDLSALVREVTNAHHVLARRKHQVLDVHIPAETDFQMTGDSKRLREVIGNLVNNAIKYAPLETTIDVRLKRFGSLFHIDVEDEGPGLSVEDQAKLFQPFQPLSSVPTGHESSTGLGLSIAKRLTELHGGQIIVSSTLGVGSTFRVILPSTDPSLSSEIPEQP